MEIFEKEYYKTLWRMLFGIWLIHGLIALWQFGGGTSLGRELFFSGFSYKYFFVCFLLVLWIFLNIYLIIISNKEPLLWLSWLELFKKAKTRDYLLAAALLFLLVRCSIWYLYGLVGDYFPLFSGYIGILMPILNLVAYISLETIVLITYINMNSFLTNKKIRGSFPLIFFIVCSLLFVLIVIVYFSGLGILPNYKGDWSRGLPAVPLLEWQILLACLTGFGLIYFESKIRHISTPLLNFFIFLFIWLGASLFWISQPVIPNVSALTPQEPNFEIYPFIDAQTYDREAQSILVGAGFSENNIPQRPLYIVFLTIVHLIVGQDYHQMVAVQSFVFALFPALLFLLGSELFGRSIGISLALLAVFRDYTSNLVSPFTGNLSYSKVFLSEIPTAMLLVWSLLIGVRWLKSNYSPYWGFILGGILGIAMLVRTQVIVVFPTLILFGVLNKPREINFLVRKFTFVLISLILVISPWLWRNWKITGDLIFDNPESQTGNLALRYSRLNGVELDAPRFPGETSSEFAARLLGIAKDAIVANPMGAIWAVSNSFLNHGIDNILVFPLRDEIRNLDELWTPTNAFWEKWEGRPTQFQAILLTIYIILFALGVSLAWYKNGWLGLLPLACNLAYNLWTSIALLAGQRFMLAMDWSIYLYYMLGLFAVLGACLFAFNRTRELGVGLMKKITSGTAFSVPDVKVWNFLATGILFLMIGLSLPIAEEIFPNRYPAVSPEEFYASIFNSSNLVHSSAENIACLGKILTTNEIQILQGRALYPRYYQAGDGEATDALGYKPIDQGRLVFEVVGQASFRVVFPMQQSPDFFPHASDITLISSQSGEPWFVLVSQGKNQKFYASDNFDEALCD